MAPNIKLLKQSLIKKMGKKRSETDPEIIKIFNEYGIQLPSDLNADFLTDKEIVALYDAIQNYEFYAGKLTTNNDDDIWIDPAGGTHHGDEVDPAAMYESLNEDLMSSLLSMGYGDSSRQSKSPGKLYHGDRVIYRDMDGKSRKGTIDGDADEKRGKVVYSVLLDDGEEKWGYEEQFKKLNEAKSNGKQCPECGSTKTHRSKETHEDIWICRNCGWEWEVQSSSGYLGERKKTMNKKKQLKETSHELDLTRNFMRYEDSDVVENIKKVFEKSDYSEFTLDNIQSNGDKFFNIEVSYELEEDDAMNFEFKRASLIQKIHKLRSKLFADIATEVPVINSNIGAISMGPGSNKAKFVIVLLTSDTNNRDWATGKKKKVVKESVEVSTQNNVSLTPGNLYLYEKGNTNLVLEYVEKIQGGRKFKVLDKKAPVTESFAIKESEINTVIKTKQSLDESLNRLLEFSLPPAGRPRDTRNGSNLTIDQLKLLVKRFREWCTLVTSYESSNHKKADQLAVQYLVPYNLVRQEPGDEDMGYSFYDVNECSIKNPNFKSAIEKLAQEYIY